MEFCLKTRAPIKAVNKVFKKVNHTGDLDQIAAFPKT